MRKSTSSKQSIDGEFVSQGCPMENDGNHNKISCTTYLDFVPVAYGLKPCSP